MPRRASTPPVMCDHFMWRVFARAGVFYADGRTGKFKLGKHSLGTRDRDEALFNLRVLDRRKAIELGLAKPSPETATPSVLPLPTGREMYLANCGRGQVLGGVGPRTIKRYAGVRDKHIAFCETSGIRSWQEVDKPNTEKYGAWLVREGYADRSIYLELTLVKSVIGWLIEEGHLPPTCHFKLKLTKPEGTDTYCYLPAEVKAMVGHCREHPELRWLWAVVVALSCTGLRIGELASLRWSDIHVQSNTILLTDERASSRRKQLGHVRTTKGKRSRALPIHPDLLKVLTLLEHNKSTDGRIFHGPRGGALKPDTVRNIFLRDVIEPLKTKFPTSPGEIGFEHGRLHSFRHYFCSEAFAGGAAEADIKDWLGHRESKMVAHYRHQRREESQNKMNQIDFLGRRSRVVRRRGRG